MKSRFKFLLISFSVVTTLFLSAMVLNPNAALAQSCSCTVCQNQGTCGRIFDPISGTFKPTCVNASSCGSVSGSLSGSTCTYFSFSSSCHIDSSTNSCILDSGSTPGQCTIVVPPPTIPPPTTSPTNPPPPVNGSCGSCNSCGAPQNECALINGVCSKAGYCSGGGPPAPFGCNVVATVRVQGSGVPNYGPYNIGDQMFTCGRPYNVDGLITGIRGITSNGTVINYNAIRRPVPASSYLSANTNYCMTSPIGTAVGAGVIPLRVYVYGKRCPACGEEVMCWQNTANVTVVSPVAACTQPTVTAAPQCSLVSGGNAQVTFQWVRGTTEDQYDFSVVDTTTGTTIGGTDTGFVAANSATFNFCAAPGSTCAHAVNLPSGAVNYAGKVIAHSSTALCSDATGNSSAFAVAVCAANSWWQAGSGDIITQGAVTSNIPPSVVDNKIITDGTGGYPGVLMTSQSGNIDPGTGTISSTDWKVQSPFAGRQPSYQDFVDLIPASVTPFDPNGSGSASWNNFKSAPGSATDSNSYTWYKHDGDLIITNDIDISGADANRKILLYVTGNLTINGKINIQDPKSGFFMAMAGKNAGGGGGNITVGAGVSSVGTTPSLSGIFFCEGKFNTGTNGGTDQRLNIYGSVAALGGVTLQRDLKGGNNTDPGESFNMSPELMINYPPTLTFKRPLWKEVAP